MRSSKSSDLNPVANQASLSSPLFWIVALGTFFAICLNYAIRLNLWGDEVFSLMSASLGGGHKTSDVHLPTYYWLLAMVVGGVGDNQETLLRMIHAVPFAVGLGFGFLTVHRTRPTLKPYSLIPFRAIASDLVDYGQAHGVDQFLLSNNSLNALSIEHYLNKLTDPGLFEIKRVDSAGVVTTLEQNQRMPFLFVSHMGENGQFVDVTTLPVQDRTFVNSYVSLVDLPYNRLWLRRYSDGAGQSHIVQTYEIR